MSAAAVLAGAKKSEDSSSPVTTEIKHSHRRHAKVSARDKAQDDNQLLLIVDWTTAGKNESSTTCNVGQKFVVMTFRPPPGETGPKSPKIWIPPYDDQDCPILESFHPPPGDTGPKSPKIWIPPHYGQHCSNHDSAQPEKGGSSEFDSLDVEPEPVNGTQQGTNLADPQDSAICETLTITISSSVAAATQGLGGDVGSDPITKVVNGSHALSSIDVTAGSFEVVEGPVKGRKHSDGRKSGRNLEALRMQGQALASVAQAMSLQIQALNKQIGMLE